ncbi:DUF1294 domain-containing protein [Clostridium gasigenes]|uniref:DUF1294 domain-containing protein n=1 Tax=Clostridium gasigenes TaxID=94869 RepID=A0A1H0NAJ9_9CLOT|nr:DUF1294 domain-containing protein [Clostridium gasigenes]MBB6715995.1 DUF1294 domain-containing protein [Clostridium gasigenes]SDO89739.1 Uncharacterized membrane protein YsdA, DUF1294 family [Clostridium gasigenes]
MQTLILLYFSIINLVGFLLMLVDKRRAIKHEWRISELNLFIVSIIGGSIGSYLGMYCFRHKTKSLKFTLGIPIIILIQGYLAIIL